MQTLIMPQSRQALAMDDQAWAAARSQPRPGQGKVPSRVRSCTRPLQPGVPVSMARDCRAAQMRTPTPVGRPSGEHILLLQRGDSRRQTDRMIQQNVREVVEGWRTCAPPTEGTEEVHSTQLHPAAQPLIVQGYDCAFNLEQARV